MHNILDADVVDAHQAMYQAWAFPNEFPKERQPALSNWDYEDLVAYVGGKFAKSAYQNINN